MNQRDITYEKHNQEQERSHFLFEISAGFVLVSSQIAGVAIVSTKCVRLVSVW